MARNNNNNNVIVPREWNGLELQNNHVYGLHNNLLSAMSIPSTSRTDTMYIFSKQVKPHSKVTNQQSSGRCWIFAALNMIRNLFITSGNLSNDFEFSQSYLFFWDKFERVNYFIDVYEKTKEEDLNSQKVQFLLKDPLGDGGQWQMFVNVVEKYGLVPLFLIKRFR